jgi:hypothetical protein
MGSISSFNLTPIIEKYNTKIYVETGTGIAECLTYANKFSFDKLYSVELDGDLANEAKLKVPSEKVEIINDYSTNGLKNNILPNLPKDEPVLFFLDAHFPGADFHKISYEESITQYKEESLPLKLEVDIILENRDISKDVFIIDDWFLYQPELTYEANNTKNWPYSELQKSLNLIQDDDATNIISRFEATHNIEVDPRHQGYLVITPKSNG